MNIYLFDISTYHLLQADRHLAPLAVTGEELHQPPESWLARLRQNCNLTFKALGVVTSPEPGSYT